MDRPMLEATKRQELGTRAARRIRSEGGLPAVLYGHKRDTVHLTVPLKAFEIMFGHGARLVDIEIGGTQEPAIIKDLQYDSMGDHIMHIDFARVAMDEKITVTVPVELHGLAIGTTHGGVLDHVLVDIEVSCLPGDIPDCVRVEVAHLDVGDVVHVRDVEAPPGCELLQDADSAVVTIHASAAAVSAAEEEEDLGIALGTAEPEMIGRTKEEGGENEG